MKSVWQVDAGYIKDSTDVNTKSLVITKSIQNFLDIERDTKYFIIAPKGFGKTLFLKYKRLLYQKKYKSTNENEEQYSINLIPHQQLVDKAPSTLTFSKEKVNLLKNKGIWEDIWSLSILLTVLKNIKPDENNVYINEDVDQTFKELKQLSFAPELLNKPLKTPFDFLAYFLEIGYKEFYEFRRELKYLTAIIRGKRIQAAIFIDNVDEFFSEHIEDNSNLKPLENSIKKNREKDDTIPKQFNEQLFMSDGITVLSPDIWYQSQIGLLKAVRVLSSLNQHIKVFASIRKEAYLYMKITDPLAIQISGNSVDLKYSKNELRDIFINNIKIEKRKNLVYPKSLDANPIFSFMGFEIIQNSHTNEDENIFDYIYRHTLKRPRDFMLIGSQLVLINRIDDLEIKKVVNTCATDIALGYITEVAPHIDIDVTKFNDLYKLIETNIIPKKKIKVICSQFNSKISCEKECKNCSQIHVFCNLYKIGLIGIMKLDEESNEYYQKFLLPGEMTFAEPGILPQSPYYLIHPVLNKLIYDKNKEYYIDTTIVGDGREWKTVKKKLNSKNTRGKIDVSENSVFPHISELESEICDIFKSLYQKERKDDISEVNSKTLKFLKYKILDVCASLQEINWLDVGCGDGRCLEILDEFHHKVNINYYGIDNSFKYLDDAEKRASKYKITAKFNKLNADNINFDSEYDLISAILVLHEIDPLRLPYILRNMLRALKEDGTIIISDFEGPYEQEKDVVAWNAEDIRQLLEKFGKIGMSIKFDSAKKYPNELGFYQCYIKKVKFNEENFNGLLHTYGDFLESKKEKSKKIREDLRNDIEKRISEILKRNDIDTKNINNEEKKRIRAEVEEEYGIKAHKIRLLTNQIIFLDNKIKEFNAIETNF